MSNSYFNYQDWAEEIDEQERVKTRNAQEEWQTYRKRRELWLSKVKAKHGDYWIGPAEVRIPWHITQVPSMDGVNYATVNQNGDDSYVVMETQVCGSQPPYTIEKYRNKFAVQNPDDQLWYWTYHQL